ncbi:MAG: hypothetical protein AAF399_10230 [Bacteroidota bacterium]
MRNHLLFFLTLLTMFSWGTSFAQDMVGEVSFLTSRNVYVKFDNTEAIQVGDSLQLATSKAFCLVVTNKSSSSLVCEKIGDCLIQKGDQILAKVPDSEAIEPSLVDPPVSATDPPSTDSLASTYEPEARPEEVIRGRISLSEYSNIGSATDDRHRVMGRLSLNAENIGHSRFSAETYLNYRQIFPTDTQTFAPNTRFFRVFNLAATYQGDRVRVTAGRKINPKISSLGAIDGIQTEVALGQSYVGAIVGSRPDIQTFSFNPNLLEYGGYVGHQTQHKNLRSLTTIGAIEQRNQNAIDRRYAYFQHSSTIARQLTLFSSMEVDLYQAINGVKRSDFRLSNLFVSANYRMGRKANLMVSYDSRKRILYYETFQNEIERLLDDDLARQGVRVRLNLRPWKLLRVGGSYAKRFQSDTQNRSDNFHGFASLTKIPRLGGRLTLSYNHNISNFLTSQIFAIRHHRRLIDGKLNGQVYYRYVGYAFGEAKTLRIQHTYGTQLNWQFSRTLSLGLTGELATFNEEQNYRLYLRLIKRFRRRKA